MAAVRAVADLVEHILSATGPLPAWCEEQRQLARIVAEALDAPPRDGAFVTLTQAATGTGKTIALLGPLMALSALQKKQGVASHRATLSTFTNYLTRQILDDDAPMVNEALKALGYPVIAVAARVGRRQFIDHDRVGRAVQELRDRRDRSDASALERLSGFETFAETEDHQVFVPAGFTTDDLCLTPRSSRSASAAFMARKQAVAAADLILTNHALALTDCRYRGGYSEPESPSRPSCSTRRTRCRMSRGVWPTSESVSASSRMSSMRSARRQSVRAGSCRGCARRRLPGETTGFSRAAPGRPGSSSS